MENAARTNLIRTRFLFVFILTYFAFITLLFLRSFPAEYNIYLRYQIRMQTNDPFWTSFWFGSELSGELGLILRFIGACFLLVFTWLLFRHGTVTFSNLKRAVLLEGIYYLFMIPFILSLYLRPNTNAVNLQAAFSYTLQILLITPAFLILFSKIRKQQVDKLEFLKWGAIAVVGFTFALWIKHFMLMLYALPINFDNAILALGSINSSITILAGGIVLIVALLPLIRKQQSQINPRLVGVGFLLIALHFAIYIGVSLAIQRYWDFMMLTDIWALGFLILAVGYISKK